MMRAFTIAQLKDPRAKPATYGGGRVCAEDDCETRLSVYNASAYCALHDHSRTEMMRAAGPKPAFERRCAAEKCGVLFLATNRKRVYCSDRCRAAVFEQRRVRPTSD